ncbi:MAG TPA: enoyl-CoA hydratase-related protein [Candidatus Polarisedimenticolia bacterium]|nr:enoyl-CoA hydratase-related protein [Candidatus Polarisedimenticolia bacterium]
MAFINIGFSVQDRIATVTIDRPDVRNAVDESTAVEIERALQEAEDSRDVAVLVFTGGGEKVFVSGADLKDLHHRRARQVLEACLNRLFSRIDGFTKPTIAAMNGHALGGGMEMALACDFRIAVAGAKLGFPEVGLGILPGAGGTQRLPRLVGLGRAKELILTGDPVDAERALELGLVHKVVPREELAAATRELAEKLASRAPVALRLAKAALNLSARVPLDSGLAFEVLSQTVLFETKDKKEGVSAFLEKRKPRFQGE